MRKINPATAIMIGIIVVVVAVIWIYQSVRGPIAPSYNVPVATTPTTTNQTPSTSGGNANQTPVRTLPAFYITSPAAGAVWALNQSHVISWNKATEITGGIYLENTSGAVVGWILSYTNPPQTSYAWDGTYVSTGRTLPTKITPPAGIYKIVVQMDNKPPTTMTSGKFALQ